MGSHQWSIPISDDKTRTMVIQPCSWSAGLRTHYICDEICVFSVILTCLIVHLSSLIIHSQQFLTGWRWCQVLEFWGACLWPLKSLRDAKLGIYCLKAIIFLLRSLIGISTRVCSLLIMFIKLLLRNTDFR